MTTEIRLFGAPTITRDGTQRSVDTRKAIAVLAYLAIEGPTVRRDRLAWLLWPESSQEKARAALRRTLSALRGAAGPGAVAADRETVTLEASDVDVRAFASAVEVNDSERAASLYRGEFLEGFSLRDAPDFDDWHRIEAGRLRHEADRTLATLAERMLEAGNLPAAADHTRRRLVLDPLNEEAHRSLMLIYAREGKRGDAFAQYRSVVRVLDEELGVAPLTETTELYELIRRGEVGLAAPLIEVDVPAPSPHALQIVGRDAELARFDAALASGRGTVLAVIGEPGSGKSVLLDELSRRSAALGRPVATTRCFENEHGLAFAPLVVLLRKALEKIELDGSIREAVGRILPEHRTPGDGPADSSTDGPGSRLRLFDAWVGALDAAGFGRGVLLIDDGHLADQATLEFVSYLANRIEDRDWIIVVTLDVGGWRPLPSSAEIVRLGRLDRMAVARLAAGLGITDEAHIERAFTASEGMPLLAVEYLTGDVREGIPDRVRLAMLGRLETLPAATLQVTESAAVLGSRFDFDLIRDVAGRSAEEVAAALDHLTAVDVLRSGPDGTYEFSLGALADVAYEDISHVRRRLLHQRAAVALDAARDRKGEAARHYERAGDDIRAAAAHVAAAAGAISAFANTEALTHVRAALALGHPDRAALHERAGDLESLEGDYPAALGAYETAAAITTGNRLASVEHKLGILHLRRGDIMSAQSHLWSALAELPPDAAVLRARILAAAATAAEQADELGVAHRLATESVEVAVATGDLTAEATTLGVGGLIALRSGDHATASRLMRDSLRVSEVGRLTASAAAAYNGLGLVLLETDDPAGAADHFSAAIALLERLGDRHRLAAALSNLADAQHAQGREALSMEHVKHSAKLLADIGGSPLELEGNAGVWSLTAW